MKKSVLVLITLVMFFSLPLTTFAETIGLQADADTYIESAYPAYSNGSASTGWVGWTPDGIEENPGTRRFLLRFNLSTLPQNAIVSNAVLNLYGNSYYGSVFPVSLHNITTAWDENITTWDSFGNGSNFDNSQISSIMIGAIGWYKWDIIKLLNNWKAGTPNNGVLLKENPSDYNDSGFFSRNHWNGSVRPRLDITYTIPAPPAPVVPVVPSALKTSLSFKVTPSAITVGKAVVVKGQLKDSNGKPVAGKNVKIKANGKAIKIVKTNSGGTFSFKHKPNKTTKYQAVYGGDASFTTASSKGIKVTVKKAKKKKK